MKHELAKYYFSSDQTVSATEAVRKFSHIRQLAEDHPVHISTNRGDQQTLLSRRFYEDLISPRKDGDDLNYKVQLDLVLDTVDTVIIILDRDMHIVKMNLAARRVLSLSDYAIGGQAISSPITPQHQYILSRAETVMRTGAAQRFETVASYDENQIRSIRIIPWQGGVAIFSDDATANRDLRKLKAHHHAVASALSTFQDLGSGVFDGSGRLQSVSAGFKKLLETDDSETLLGMRFLSLFSSESCEILDRHMFTSEKTVNLQVDLIAAGTRALPCELALSGYWDHGDGRCHAFAIRPLSPRPPSEEPR